MRAKTIETPLVRVVLPYHHEHEFLERELELLGRWGSFLPGTDAPCGAVVAFELTLADGTPVLRGEGRILGHVASRRGDRGAVIRFTRLDRRSRALVEHAADLFAAQRSHNEVSTAGHLPAAPHGGAESMLEKNRNAGKETNASATNAERRSESAPSNAAAATGPTTSATDETAAGRAARPKSERSRDELLRTLRHRNTATVPRLVEPPAPAAISTPEENGGPRSMQSALQEARTQSKRNALYLVAGSKGGVGKSMVTMALVDMLREQGHNVFLVECDNSNPDVWKAHKDEVRSELVNLDEAEGWIRLLNICDSNREHVVVVNTAARNNTAVSRFGSTLNDSLDELGRELVTFWVINRQRDSLELLNEFMTAIPRSTLHVVRNGYFGEERKFELYNSSPTREQIESKGGKSITFADLADRVADDLYSKHLSIGAATRTLPLGNRAELSRWRTEVKKGFAGLLNGQ